MELSEVASHDLLIRIDRACTKFCKEMRDGLEPTINAVLMEFSDAEKPKVYEELLKEQLEFLSSEGRPQKSRLIETYPEYREITSRIFEEVAPCELCSRLRSWEDVSQPKTNDPVDGCRGYRFSGELGKGGFGWVGLAHDSANQKFAIKVLCPRRHFQTSGGVVSARPSTC